MRCAFQVGVIECLAELSIEPSLVVGVSGGVWNGAAVAAGTHGRLRHYWRTFARMPRLDFRNVLREHSPFIFPELHRRTFSRYVGPARLKSADTLPFWVALTRLRDRVSVLIDARTVDDPLQLLLAANFLPPFYTHTPPIGSERYGDGGVTNNCPYEKAFEEGCDAVVLVSLKGESEGGLYRSATDTEHHIAPQFADRTVVIRPRHRLPLSFTERRWEKLRDAMDIGYFRAREVLCGEIHPQTGIRASLPAPSVVLARWISILRS
jgi:predicted acylesterase/phospholipase RssA